MKNLLVNIGQVYLVFMNILAQSRVRWRVGVVDGLCPGRDQAQKKKKEFVKKMATSKDLNDGQRMHAETGLIYLQLCTILAVFSQDMPSAAARAAEKAYFCAQIKQRHI